MSVYASLAVIALICIAGVCFASAMFNINPRPILRVVLGAVVMALVGMIIGVKDIGEGYPKETIKAGRYGVEACIPDTVPHKSTLFSAVVAYDQTWSCLLMRYGDRGRVLFYRFPPEMKPHWYQSGSVLDICEVNDELKVCKVYERPADVLP